MAEPPEVNAVTNDGDVISVLAWPYHKLATSCLAAGLGQPCPSCYDFHKIGMIQFSEILSLRGGALDAISRRDKTQHICRRCERLEGTFLRYMNVNLSMSWPIIYRDWSEAIRLPAGLTGGWGASHYPTGGLQEWMDWSSALEAIVSNAPELRSYPKWESITKRVHVEWFDGDRK